MRIFGWISLLAAIAGWSTWFVICNVYEFAPPLDPWALAFAWLISVAALGLSLRSVDGRRWGWGLCWLAASFAGYLLLIHRGVGPAPALALLVVVGLGIVAIAARRRRSGR